LLVRVALLTREFPPEVYGGAGVHIENLAANLAPLIDVEVHAFGAPRSSPLVAATYSPWDALRGGPGGGALQPVSVDLLMAQGVADVDLVHSHTWYTNLGGHLAKEMYGIPHVVTTHSLEPLRPWKRDQLGPGYGVSLFCERTAINGADAVIAVSAGMRADVLETYPAVDPDRVVVIYNGVDPDDYRPDPRTDALVRHGIDPDQPSVVFLGRITAQKGILELLAAAQWIHPSAQLVLCAASPDTPAIQAAVAEGVAALRQHRRGVVWIAEPLTRPEAVQVLSHASVFVCPSRYEPFGLVNVEAMACGVAVVATATGGIPEIVEDGVTGYLVAPGPEFVPALAERINALVLDPETARRFGEAGRQRVLDRFTWPAVAAQTADLYRKVLR
jgi:starch synthase